MRLMQKMFLSWPSLFQTFLTLRWSQGWSQDGVRLRLLEVAYMQVKMGLLPSVCPSPGKAESANAVS